LPKNGITDVVYNLMELGKELFIDSCVKNRDEDEDEDEDFIREDSNNWFGYIYENEEYPE
jgi:hypothetical protein